MVSIDDTDINDTTRLVTQLLLQIMPRLPRETHPEAPCMPAPSTLNQSDITKTAVAALNQVETREEAGCHLWDMTSSEESARIALQHGALEILPEVVLEALSSAQARIAELLIGSMANIVCHRTLAGLVSSRSGQGRCAEVTSITRLAQHVCLGHSIASDADPPGDCCNCCSCLQAAQKCDLQLAVLQITFSTTDAPCLAEAFRLLATALKGPGSHIWLAHMLQNSQDFVQHVVWIADNTLNAPLLERYRSHFFSMHTPQPTPSIF